MTERPPDPGYASILAFTQHDPVAAEELRRALVVIRENHPDRELRWTVDDVLKGRLTFREMSRRPEVQAAMADAVTRFSEKYDAMSPAERERMERAGEAATAEIRDDLARG